MDSTQNEKEFLIKSLERALFLARNDRIVAFAAVYSTEGKDCIMIKRVPSSHHICAAGMTATLLADIIEDGRDSDVLEDFNDG